MFFLKRIVWKIKYTTCNNSLSKESDDKNGKKEEEHPSEYWLSSEGLNELSKFQYKAVYKEVYYDHTDGNLDNRVRTLWGKPPYYPTCYLDKASCAHSRFLNKPCLWVFSLCKFTITFTRSEER